MNWGRTNLENAAQRVSFTTSVAPSSATKTNTLNPNVR